MYDDEGATAAVKLGENDGEGRRPQTKPTSPATDEKEGIFHPTSLNTIDELPDNEEGSDLQHPKTFEPELVVSIGSGRADPASFSPDTTGLLKACRETGNTVTRARSDGRSDGGAGAVLETELAPSSDEVIDSNRDSQPSNRPQEPLSHHSESSTKAANRSNQQNRFIGVGGRALIGDMIIPGLGTLGGAVLGGVGGHEYGKRRSRSPGRGRRRYSDDYLPSRRTWESRMEANGNSGKDEQPPNFSKQDFPAVDDLLRDWTMLEIPEP